MYKKVLFIPLFLFLLTSCATPSPSQESTSHTTISPETTIQLETTVPETTAPAHSPLYIPYLDTEDVITYFNEVCLDAEFVNSGDATLLQKWAEPICYQVNGTPTEEDLKVLDRFTAWLNTVEGFPGITENKSDEYVNLQIYFCPEAELIERMGENFAGLDGAVTFWYTENEIYDAIICIRTDLDQETRNSVILEEIYNGLGPVQDTDLRQESIIYSGFSTPQALTKIDELILKLLYHPDIHCGMIAEECESVIRELYY